MPGMDKQAVLDVDVTAVWQPQDQMGVRQLQTMMWKPQVVVLQVTA